ncbi:MAG: hypothetical protein R2865_02900 [Deinococcales bacterium]
MAQPGVIQEFEYRSLDGRYYVGMTLYESIEAFSAILSKPEFLSAPEFAEMFANYPPLISQMAIPLNNAR